MRKVKFKFGYACRDGVNEKGAIDAGMTAFGQSHATLKRVWDSEGYIICTAEQFAVWLIYRQGVCGQNQFAALDVKLIDSASVLDVSGAA